MTKNWKVFIFMGLAILLGVLLVLKIRKEKSLSRIQDEIRGTDSNHNGVRDDVEAFIEKTYASSARKKAVAMQFAKKLQKDIESPEMTSPMAVWNI